MVVFKTSSHLEREHIYGRLHRMIYESASRDDLSAAGKEAGRGAKRGSKNARFTSR